MVRKVRYQGPKGGIYKLEKYIRLSPKQKAKVKEIFFVDDD